MKKEEILTVKNLTKSYGKGHTKVTAINNVSFSVAAGDIILIIGPSGSGKTTLLTMIGLLLTPNSGSITYMGQDITDISDKKKSKFRLKNIGFVFQSFNLIDSMKAWENIYYVNRLVNKNRFNAKKKTNKIMKKLGIDGIANNKSSTMSGGEKQRTAIARALINEPSLILADEPTANLDSENGLNVATTLSQIVCEENRAVIIVSHDMRLVKVATRIITLVDGKVAYETKGMHKNVCPHHRK